MFVLFLGTYVGTIVLMSLYQWFIIPFASPDPPYGLTGHDQLHYHELATDLMKEIKDKGWSAWSLRPEGQAPAGFLAAIYLFTGPNPRAVIPLNALLHVLGVLALFSIVRGIVSWKAALVLCVPFWLSPYQMELFSQPNKDSFAAAGAMIFIYGWIRTFTLFQAFLSYKSKCWFYALGAILAGAALMLVVRPYLIAIIIITGGIFLGWLCVRFVKAIKFDGTKALLDECAKLLSILLLLILIAALSKVISSSQYDSNVASLRLAAVKASKWNRTSWIPERLDTELAKLMISYRGSYRDFLHDGLQAREALIDIHQSFESALDVVAYVPRALQIGFFAPFPSHWCFVSCLDNLEKLDLSTWYPRPPIRGIRMLFAYVGYLFLCWGVMNLRCRQELIISLIFSVTYILLYALSVPHIGALARYKLSCFFLLTTLGFACFVKFWTGLRCLNNKEQYTAILHPPKTGTGRTMEELSNSGFPSASMENTEGIGLVPGQNSN
jgi:hypothetical protein